MGSEKKIEDMSFEEGIAELESLSQQMSKSGLSLEESLKVYERGVKLSKHCKKLLDTAQKKIQVLDDELAEFDSNDDQGFPF